MTDPERISDELRPCPFCGKAMERVEQSMDGPYWGHPLPGDDICPAAGFYLTDNNKKRAAEVAAWNTRRSPPAQEGMVLDAPAREGGGEVMWKAGQTVIAKASMPGEFTEGRSYVLSHDHDGSSPTGSVRVVSDDTGNPNGWGRSYFKLASPAEPAAHSLQTLAPASDAVKPGDETTNTKGNAR